MLDIPSLEVDEIKSGFCEIRFKFQESNFNQIHTVLIEVRYLNIPMYPSTKTSQMIYHCGGEPEQAMHC